jgi:lysine 2,3-aminomutase
MLLNLQNQPPFIPPDNFQPYQYAFKSSFAMPDWTRLPGFKQVSKTLWEDARWQHAHSVKNVRQLKAVFQHLLSDELANAIERDQREVATMSLLIPPHMLNCMNEYALETDPIRRYAAPAFTERDAIWTSHPYAQRDSLNEAQMWAVEGLTHRYPTKVLVELTHTCPQYCGHCTRMDLVGNHTDTVKKLRFRQPQSQRWQAMLDYLRQTPAVRDVIVSGGDIANVTAAQLEAFVTALLAIPHIRDIRLASKALINLPQHFLQTEVMAVMQRLAQLARRQRVNLTLHTHANHANELTPLTAKAIDYLLDMGFRDVRNQGVLLRGVNDSQTALLDLCFSLLNNVRITPYYFYMCDMIPNSEHWRLTLAETQKLQESMMGYLPGFATPRFVCDIPDAGKQWVHQVHSYDRERGISTWRKHYLTPLERQDAQALNRDYFYYDPISRLPEAGQRWWQAQQGQHKTTAIAPQPPSKAIRVGFIYNQKRIQPEVSGHNDAEAEFDSPKILDLMRATIRELGFEVVNLEAVPELPRYFDKHSVDIVFNIAEGFQGRSRESWIPALLELWGIPYVGSDAVTMAVCLDKALAKTVVKSQGVPTAAFVTVNNLENLAAVKQLHFPVVVKPLAEGSSKGILPHSVIAQYEAVLPAVQQILLRYQQPTLVEEYLSGREFTVAVLGYPNPRVLSPMEIKFLDTHNPTPVYSFDTKQAWTDKIAYQVPADLSAAQLAHLQDLALKAFHALGCRDMARIDFRMDAEQQPHFIECNPIPGFAFGWSDFVRIAEADGIDYAALLKELLSFALLRKTNLRV